MVGPTGLAAQVEGEGAVEAGAFNELYSAFKRSRTFDVMSNSSFDVKNTAPEALSKTKS